MNANSCYFLVVAEELNISRAAKRLYISQQALSSHIKRLEEQYGVILFNRKPKLSLTQAGEALVQGLQRIHVLENSIYEELADIEKMPRGVIRIGLHASRSRIIVPMVIPRFMESHPRVEITILEGTTNEFEALILDGSLDLFIGLNPNAHPLRHAIKLMDEGVYVAISIGMMKTLLPDCYRRYQSSLLPGVWLSELTSLPFILNHERSNLTSYIQGVLENVGVALKVPLRVNGNEMHIELSARGYGACFIPQLYVPFVTRHNEQVEGDRKLCLLPVYDFSEPNAFCIVHHAEMYLGKHIKNFIDVTMDCFEEMAVQIALKQG